MEEKKLHLPLKKKWFDYIKNGAKLEEYRDLSNYWIKRLMNNDGSIKQFTQVHFTLGYPKKDNLERHMIFDIKRILITEGREEWGAIPGKVYFVIKLGDRKM